MELSIKTYRNKISIFIIFIILLFCSGHALQTIFVPLLYLPILSLTILMPAIYQALKNHALNIYTGTLLLFILLIFLTCITSMDGNYGSYFLNLFTISSAFAITYLYNFHEFSKYYLKFMKIITVISLIGYTLANSQILVNHLPLLSNLNGVCYRVGLIFNYIDIIPERNCGIFWEPGLFASYLILALILEITKKKINIINISIFLLGLLTAHSSAGYVLLVMVILLFFANKFNSNHNTYCVPQIICAVIITLLALNVEIFIRIFSLENNEYFTKLLPENLLNSSRFLAISHNLNIFLDNPFFGAGVTNLAETSMYVADTSTSTYLLALYGLLGGVYSVLWIIGIFTQVNLNINSKIIISLIFLSILNKEPHLNIMLSWCLLFWLIKSNKTFHKNIE